MVGQLRHPGPARTWRVTVTSFGTNMPLNGLARECRQLLGLVPAQAAAENARRGAASDRHQLIVGGGEPRAGKAHQDAAFVDPARQAVARIAGDIADIGEDDHRQALLDELGDYRPPGEPRSASLMSANGPSARDR
jgi:hypothetical protein